MAGYLKRFYDFFEAVIDHRVKCGNGGGGKNNDFLDSLLELNVESKLDRQTMKVLLTEIFAAETDTTSITVEWAMTELLHDPIALAKAQYEVRNIFQSEVPELDITKLPYLQAVVKEVMRMHPAGPLLVPREAMESIDKLGGRFIVPKGARVLVNIWAIGRAPEVWDEPNVFRPERFLEKEIDFRGKDFEFISFGFGRRICPGMPLATRIVPYIMALMLHEFDWKLPDGMEPKDVDLTEKFMATLKLVVPLYVVPAPRVND